MTIGPAELGAFLGRLGRRSVEVEQRLNAADARLGDGDTGSMLRRVLTAMAEAPVTQAEGLQTAAMSAAQAAMRETGSSLGTLVATCAMTLAREAGARPDGVTRADLPAIVAACRDAVARRGGAAEGDKTVIDSLAALASAFADRPADAATAAAAAHGALDAFRDRPCRIGRARMFPERSTGADDPGMLAVALLLDPTA